ncbi:MAG TPA: nuclear transport factor 2 family protein [Gemmatimonadaceae bacterium]|nr:nuclear transport factor 2 family protein [Gemmatimonadaceae bacterium]
MKRFLTASLLVSVIMIVPAPAFGQQSSDETAVIAAVQKMFDGMRSADSAAVRALFAPGARFAGVDDRATPPAIRFDSVDGWIAAIARSRGRWDEQIYDVQVRVDGHMAQVWAPYTFYLDSKISHCGINAIDLLRDSQGWKVTQVADTRRRENCPDPLKR